MVIQGFNKHNGSDESFSNVTPNCNSLENPKGYFASAVNCDADNLPDSIDDESPDCQKLGTHLLDWICKHETSLNYWESYDLCSQNFINKTTKELVSYVSAYCPNV